MAKAGRGQTRRDSKRRVFRPGERVREDGKLVIVDYKTDRVKEIGELKKRYEKQLAYYQHALERTTGKKVKEKIIYSLALDEELVL